MDFNELIVRLSRAVAGRRWLSFFAFILIFGATVAGAYVKPQWYESKAALLVKLETKAVSTSGSEQRNVVAHLQPEEVMASQAELLQTREMMENLLDELPGWVFESKPPSKWYLRVILNAVNNVITFIEDLLLKAKLIEPADPRHEKIQLLEKSLEVFPVRKAQLIELSFQSKNPAVPKVVLDTLIDLYQKRIVQLRAQDDGANLYMRRSEQLNEELTNAEKRLAQFMLEQNIVDLEVERSQVLGRLNTMASVVEQFETGEGGNLRLTITGSDTPPAILQQISSLSALMAERAQMSESFTPDHRDVKRLDQQIASMRRELARDYESISQSVKRSRERLQHLLKIRPQYNWLERQVRILNQSYEIYRKAAKDKETFFSRDNQILAKVVDKPQNPYAPLKPTRLILVLAGFVFAIVLALFIVLIVEWVSQLRRVYRKPETVPEPNDGLTLDEGSAVVASGD